jgi:saccharopine dehydrogenase (NAD+, L-lysine forming)
VLCAINPCVLHLLFLLLRNSVLLFKKSITLGDRKMGKALIIGAGGVASVAVHKCVQNSEVFEEICIASRTKSKCDELKAKLDGGKTKITTAQVNADNVDELIALINEVKPDIVMNLALPYQDLTIMDACLATKTHYMDTANYEPEDTAKFEYKWQWDYRERFEKAGITALLGSGFDPGVTGVFSAYALKHYFDEIEYIDILDCNGGDHGYPFATNFNPEINIREVSANGRYWENGEWIETDPMEIKRVYDFAEVGQKDMYLLYHEELESLAQNIPGLKRIRFFMTFGQSYLTHLKALENVGMTSIEPIEYEGKQIIPLQFLKAVLPDPASLGPRTVGKTNIGCIFRGKKDGKDKTYYVYNVCDHQECYKEVGSQAISYTTGVPAMIGAAMILTGKWNKAGVYNIEEFNPDPFMEELNKWGLPWVEDFNPVLVDDESAKKKEAELIN